MKKIFIFLMFAFCSLGANAVITVTISTPSGTPNSCSTYNYGYNSTGFGSDIIDSYSWTVSGGVIVGSATADNVNVIWNSVTHGSITFTLNYHNSSFSDYATDTKAITVNGSPNTSAPGIVGALPGNPNYVVVNATSVIFSVPAIPNASSYSWTYPSCFTASSSTTTVPQITFTTTGTCSGNVCVKGLNTICGSYSPTTCFAITRIPVISSITGSNVSCGTSSSAYSVPYINGISSYTWTVPAGWFVNGVLTATGIVNLAAPAGASINVTPPSANAGNKTISVYGVVAGIGNTNTQSLLVTFGVPAPATLLSSNIATVCPERSVYWYATCSSPGVTSWTWSFNPTGAGGTSTGLSLYNNGIGGCNISAMAIGNYLVNVQANNLCGSSSKRGHSCDVVLSANCPRSMTENTASSGMLLENEITVFPNPADQNLIVNINSAEASSCKITLYDMLGKQISANIKAIEIGNNQANIDVSYLKNGIYFLNIDNGIKIQKEKIIVNH